jgi:hypothetical protein
MNGQKSARVDDIQKEVDSVKNIMHDNVVRVMERGERLDNLDQRAESLQQSVSYFIFQTLSLPILVCNVSNVCSSSPTKHVFQEFEMDNHFGCCDHSVDYYRTICDLENG